MDSSYQPQTTLFFPLKCSICLTLFMEALVLHCQNHVQYIVQLPQKAVFSVIYVVVRIVTTELGRVKISRCVTK
jgi:hypothetical protein